MIWNCSVPLLALLIVANCCSAEELDYHVTDPELKVVRLDSSPDDSFLSVRTDSTGRIFVGGRKTLFAYDLDEAGKYLPRKLLFEFPDHTWVNDIEVLGDDLYVVTVSAVYRIVGGRIKRDGLKPERLLWGVPNGHVHQCFHACAWGPEGDLYVSMGDPLWYYGDFSRPDHWGHWTMFFKPTLEGSQVLSKPNGDAKVVRIGTDDWASLPYNGVGGIFRIRPDGTNLRSFARGLRNPCGLCFDKNWNLFTNDNDHEGMPSLYAPGRLIHVKDGTYWSWPRGWMQSKTPDRADILPMVNDEMGRAVPVLQTYYSDKFLPSKYDSNLLVARWCRRTISRFPLEAKDDTFTAKEHVMLEGRDQARPVGVCVGRGGRVFVTICYMAQNEGSPTYRSDLAVITRKDDPDSMPFDSLDVTKLTGEQLWDIRNERSFSNSIRSRTLAAYQEQQRRDAVRSIEIAITRQKRDQAELAKSIRDAGNLTQSMEDIRKAKSFDPNPGIKPGTLECLRWANFSTPALTTARCRDADPAIRLGGVLTAGFRLTMPPVHARLSADAPLAPQQKEEANIIQFADEKEPLDLRKFGRVGNYTVAEHWKALKHTDEQEQLFALLMERLDDSEDKIRLQAAHFLSLLNDPRSEPKIAKVVSGVQDRRLDVGKLEHLKPLIWMLGPVPDADGLKTVHPIETSAIDLSVPVTINGKSFEWKQTKPTSPDRPLYDFGTLFGPSPNSSVYSLFRFDSPTAQRMQLLVGSEDGVKVWLNGNLVHTNDVVRPLIQLDDVVPLDLQPGSNDVLVRVGMRRGLGGQYLHFRHLGNVRLSLPEKPDGLSLADRLKSIGDPAASGGKLPAVDPKFVQFDWTTEVKNGDVARGKKLFGAESLGCAKCHAATATQAGGGGPSLADAGKRFTVPYLVESVLVPSKVISPVFKSTVIATHEGKVIMGLVIAENAEKVDLLLPDTKKISIQKSQIDERKLGDISAMPVGLVKTPEELRDVLAYLIGNPTE